MSYFRTFQQDVSNIELPEKFTFPFYYEPHPLTLLASVEVQKHLENQTEFEHNFGIDKEQEGLPVGKMFGVLIVQNQDKELGYLAAFSGKLADKSLPNSFVPPVYNIYAPDSFFLQGEEELNTINQQIEDLEKAPQFIEIKEKVVSQTQWVENELQKDRGLLKKAKKDRKIRREKAETSLSPEAFNTFNNELAEESKQGQLRYKRKSKELKNELLVFQKQLEVFTTHIADLKAKRKTKSALLQQQIFDSYQFLNKNKVGKKLSEIFPDFQEQQPPGGAGDCTAPKLLQYAFLNDLKPIAIGEFWWGTSPKTEIRRHKHFYPACGGRCKPILAHMLDGIEMEEDPHLNKDTQNQEIPIIYEDDVILVVNKPAEFLTVPGKKNTDSVYSRMETKYPDATGPLIVHRLDMSTSGILILAKTKDAHKNIQEQFLKRTVKKRYVALLDGEIEESQGEINLPLRVDLDDRPRQLVCNEYGKPAKTRWKVVERKEGKTRIHLYPITGRTHQLRVHMSHPLGLNTPIIGDDLYGKKASRLHLHAEFIQFQHPITNEKMKFTVKAGF